MVCRSIIIRLTYHSVVFIMYVYVCTYQACTTRSQWDEDDDKTMSIRKFSTCKFEQIV